MGTHTVMTHAPVQGLESVLCAQCIGFGVERAATVTANTHATALDAPVGPAETLCAPCASNGWVYCNVRPLPTVAPVSDAEWLASPSVLASGVSLGKATDPAMVYRPESAPRTGDVVLTGADGSWVTRESRATVESWRADSIRVGAYEMAAAWGMVLRGEA